MRINSTEGVKWTWGIGKVSQESNSSNRFSGFLKENAEKGSIQKAQDSYVRRSAESKNFNFTGNYMERLEQITKQNEETDWDSMSDVEKVKLFEDRYSAAFKDMQIISSGLYTDYSPKYAEINDNYQKETDKYFREGAESPLNSDYRDDYKQAYYGDLSGEELRAAIREKYQGTGTMEDKFLILDEYFRCGVNKPGDAEIQSSISMQIFKQVEDAHGDSLRGTGMSISQHPRFLDMFMSYAKGLGEGRGYKPNWTQIVNEVKNMYQPGEHCSPELAEEMRKEMDDFLNEIR